MPRRENNGNTNGKKLAKMQDYDSSSESSSDGNYRNKQRNNRRGGNNRRNNSNSRSPRNNKKEGFFAKKNVPLFEKREFKDEFEESKDVVLPPTWDEVPDFSEWFEFEEPKAEKVTAGKGKKPMKAYRFYAKNLLKGQSRKPKFVTEMMRTKGVEETDYQGSFNGYQIPASFYMDTASPTKKEKKHVQFWDDLENYVGELIISNPEFFMLDKAKHPPESLKELRRANMFSEIYWRGVGQNPKKGKEKQNPNPMHYAKVKYNKKKDEIWTDFIGADDTEVNPLMCTSPHEMILVIEIESIYRKTDGKYSLQLKVDTAIVGKEIRQNRGYGRSLIRKLGVLQDDESSEDEKPKGFAEQLKMRKKNDVSSSQEESDDEPKSKKKSSPKKKSPKREKDASESHDDSDYESGESGSDETKM